MGVPIRSFLCAIGAAAVTAVLLFSSAPAQAEEMSLTPPKPLPGPAERKAYEPEWRGWIVKRGRVFRSDRVSVSESSAKMAAKGVCERKGGYTCDIGDAIAIPEGEDWVVAAIACERGSKKSYFLGASALNYSWDIAVGKARKAGFRPDDCSEIQLKSVN